MNFPISSFNAAQIVLGAVLILASGGAVGAQKPVLHRLEATPGTVAYGYYWSEAKPAIRVRSGDVIDVETMLETHLGLMMRALKGPQP